MGILLGGENGLFGPREISNMRSNFYCAVDIAGANEQGFLGVNLGPCLNALLIPARSLELKTRKWDADPLMFVGEKSSGQSQYATEGF